MLKIDGDKLNYEFNKRGTNRSNASVEMGFSKTYLSNALINNDGRVTNKIISDLKRYFDIDYDDIKIDDPVKEDAKETVQVKAVESSIDYDKLAIAVANGVLKGMDKWYESNLLDIESLINGAVFNAVNGALKKNGLNDYKDSYK